MLASSGIEIRQENSGFRDCLARRKGSPEKWASEEDEEVVCARQLSRLDALKGLAILRLP
jgi:hypothetical protein